MENNNKKLPIFALKRVLNSVGRPPCPRYGHKAIAFKNYILVFGGGNKGVYDGVHAFNIETQKWFSLDEVTNNVCPGRAAFGAVAVDTSRVIAFGGMMKDSRLSDDVFEFDASCWKWRFLQVTNGHHQPKPCPRLGHSFNAIDKKIYMFGGCTENKEGLSFIFLNDLYIMHLHEDGTVYWQLELTNGARPPPRESHSAVSYVDNHGYTKLVVFGGMNGSRLGDLWVLYLDRMQWFEVANRGKVPTPRSFHTATVMSHRMFIFGGWVPVVNMDSPGFDCTNEFACLNLETMIWEELQIEAPEEKLPKARAGHSAVAVYSGIYFWSGRYGYHKTPNGHQVCFKDMWFLEVCKPSQVTRVQAIGSSCDSLSLGWPKIAGVKYYLLQLQKCDNYDCPTSSKPSSSFKVTTGKDAAPNGVPLSTTQTLRASSITIIACSQEDMQKSILSGERKIEQLMLPLGKDELLCLSYDKIVQASNSGTEEIISRMLKIDSDSTGASYES